MSTRDNAKILAHAQKLQNPFQVVQVNGQPPPNTLWRDTVVVPRHGSVVIRSRFFDYTGLFMLHCHMMNHEELGMMQTVEVYKD